MGTKCKCPELHFQQIIYEGEQDSYPRDAYIFIRYVRMLLSAITPSSLQSAVSYSHSTGDGGDPNEEASIRLAP